MFEAHGKVTYICHGCKLINNVMLLLIQPQIFQMRVSFTSLQKKEKIYQYNQFVMQLLFIMYNQSLEQLTAFSFG